MTDRVVKVRLEATVGQYNSALESARAKTTGLSTEIQKHGKKSTASLEQVGRSAVLGGAAVVAGLGFAMNASMGFDKQLSQLRASTGANAASMGLLRDAAIRTGRDTMFSASQAAEAETALAKAGVSVADILGGALSGAVSLAAAGQLDLGQASEVAASAMTQFGLKGSDVGHVADTLAAGAGKAQGSVSDMSMALQQSGLVAAQMGLSLDDTVGMLAEFASNGLLGSDAGTSFKTMLQRLNPQSKEAADLMDQLGLRAYDAQGHFIGMSAYAGKLHDALGSMSEEQRNATLQTLFGSDAIRGASILYKDGAEGVKNWKDQVHDIGYATRFAATATDNLSGDLQNLSGSLETAFIKGGTAATGSLRDLTKFATGAVNAYSALPGPIQAVATGAVALGGAVALSGGAFMVAVPKIEAYQAAVANASGRTAMIAKGLGGLGGMLMGPLGAALAVGTVAMTLYGNERAKAQQRVEAFTQAIKADSGAIAENARAAATSALEQDGALKAAAKLGLNLRTVTDAATGNRDALGQVVGQLGALRAAQQATAGRNAGVGAFGSSRDIDLVTTSVTGLSSATDGAVAAYRREADALGPTAAAATGAAGAVTNLGGAEQTTGAQTETATEKLKKQLDTFQAMFDPLFGMQQALVQQRQAQADLTTAVHDHGAKSTEAKNAELDLLQATVGLTSASATLNGAVVGGTVSAAAMRTQLDAWTQAGLITKGTADSLAGTIGGLTQRAGQLDATRVDVGITDNAPEVATRLNGLAARLDNLDGKTVNTYVRTFFTQSGDAKSSGGGTIYQANGGIVMPAGASMGVQSFAVGGFSESHTAQIAPAGAYRVWAEPETGGEAYIPLAASKRGRSTAVWAEAGRRLGVMGDDQAGTAAAGAVVGRLDTLTAEVRQLQRAFDVTLTIDGREVGRAASRHMMRS